MKDKYLVRIEEQLAILEGICDNADYLEDEKERTFVKEGIEEEIRELNELFHMKKFEDKGIIDRFLSIITIYNQKVSEARGKGIVKNEKIDVIPC
ncbi:MAG: hypothetical protein GWP03_03835 [Proteobacteria bacterium]|nr:hypothetical protein [Pseudomonadota bacterium]